MAPWLHLGLFLAASFLMIWRLEVMAASGMEGTVLGTLITPYCTGLGNLVFAVVLARRGGSGADVMTNCLVNNVTNLTLLVGLPAALWGMSVLPTTARKENPAGTRDRLSLLLTLFAVLFFTGVAWALSRRREIDFVGGLILAGLFLCWQAYHLFAVMHTNARRKKSWPSTLPLDLVLLAIGAWGTYASTDWLVGWLSNIRMGFISARHMGWLSGWLDVLPNGVIAFYYGWKRRADVVYTSQVGDGHVCIPLCLGIFALFRPMAAPGSFETGIIILFAATLAHLVCIGVWGRLPRAAGWLLTAAYFAFICNGLS